MATGNESPGCPKHVHHLRSTGLQPNLAKVNVCPRLCLVRPRVTGLRIVSSKASGAPNHEEGGPARRPQSCGRLPVGHRCSSPSGLRNEHPIRTQPGLRLQQSFTCNVGRGNTQYLWQCLGVPRLPRSKIRVIANYAPPTARMRLQRDTIHASKQKPPRRLQVGGHAVKCRAMSK